MGGGGITSGGTGQAGGGNGSSGAGNGVSAVAYTGSGGGGGARRSGTGGSAGSGGSGIVIISYLNTFAPAASTTGSPTIYQAGGNWIYKFTGNGSITF